MSFEEIFNSLVESEMSSIVSLSISLSRLDLAFESHPRISNFYLSSFSPLDDKHPSHFSVPQAISLGLSLSNPCPPLLLLTDLTHKLEHDSLENQLQSFVSNLRKWVSNQPSDQRDIRNFEEACNSSTSKTMTKSKQKLGEGNQPRWWHSIWSEDDSERRLNLDLKSKVDGGLDLDLNERVKEFVPDFHVAFDGMSIDFEKSR